MTASNGSANGINAIDHAQIRSILEREARSHPYLLFPEVEEVFALLRPQLPNPRSKLRLLPKKSLWHVSEFFVFEGDEFADAVALALRNRLSTQEERQSIMRDSRPPNKLWMVFTLDRENRMEKSAIKVYGAPLAHLFWSISTALFDRNYGPIARPFRSWFRKLANRTYINSAEKVTLYQMLYRCLDGIERP